jgi:hypothetical protein
MIEGITDANYNRGASFFDAPLCIFSEWGLASFAWLSQAMNVCPKTFLNGQVYT